MDRIDKCKSNRQKANKNLTMYACDPVFVSARYGTIELNKSTNSIIFTIFKKTQFQKSPLFMIY
jgi:hypothetical protein